MNNSLVVSPAFGKNWGWFLTWGILLVIIGLIAISTTMVTTIISVVFLGALLLIGGIVVIIDTFTYWRGKWKGFFLHLIMGLLYLAAGFALIKNPILGSISLTLFLGVFYIAIGLFRVVYSLSVRSPQWGWSFFSGLISLLLGILIMANWPASGLFIIGLFIGIDLLFSGWAYIMASITARAMLTERK